MSKHFGIYLLLKKAKTIAPLPRETRKAHCHAYCETFGLWPYIRLSTDVQHLTRRAGPSGFRVAWKRASDAESEEEDGPQTRPERFGFVRWEHGGTWYTTSFRSEVLVSSCGCIDLVIFGMVLRGYRLVFFWRLVNLHLLAKAFEVYSVYSIYAIIRYTARVGQLDRLVEGWMTAQFASLLWILEKG